MRTQYTVRLIKIHEYVYVHMSSMHVLVAHRKCYTCVREIFFLFKYLPQPVQALHPTTTTTMYYPITMVYIHTTVNDFGK